MFICIQNTSHSAFDRRVGGVLVLFIILKNSIVIVQSEQDILIVVAESLAI